ncbi:MAG: NAD(P)-dependent oxidoreductase [Stappiaceae bacterium]
MSTVLVTGATGFLGGALARRLYNSDFQVLATGRNRQALTALSLPASNKITCDFSKPLPAEIQTHFNDVDIIVHCAALSSAWGRDADFWDSNVLATEQLLTIARSINVDHFIHISTPAVYFKFEDQFDVRETRVLPSPVNAYARTKAVAEERVLASGVPATIMRPRGIYGVGDSALMPRLLRAAQSGPLPRFRNGSVRTDITHIDDVVDAIIAAFKAKRTAIGEVFNVSGGDAIPIVEIAERACSAYGTNVRWRDLPVGIALLLTKMNEKVARLRKEQSEPRITAYGLGVFAYSQTLDISKARTLLDWVPKVSFDEGLRRTFQHFDKLNNDGA